MHGFSVRPVANGLRTDHPVPDLPFVDDAHIPVEDRVAVEAIGRHEASDMWGREDNSRDGGWVAFTTDPIRHDLAWLVRWHPDHGRSVLLYRDDDASTVHMELQETAQLYRAGGYWWDGTAWYRPPQIWDTAGQAHLQRRVPAAATVTAADLLQAGGDPHAAAVLAVQDIDLDNPPAAARWGDDLALWADRRRRRSAPDQDLARSVVGLTAPELTGDQLVGLAELAAAAGIAPSTLRAYIAREESDVPAPQATISGRSVWSRPVAVEWAEQRRADNLDELVTGDRPGTAGSAGTGPAGVEEIRSWFGRLFFDRLWRNPERRRRWALRARNQAAVQNVATELAGDVAGNLRRLVQIGDLAITIRHAVLGDFRTSEDLDRAIRDDVGRTGPTIYSITRPVGRMLGWLIRHEPNLAGSTIGDIVGEAARELGVAQKDSAYAIRVSVGLDGGLSEQDGVAYLDQVLGPLLEGAANRVDDPPTGRPVPKKGPRR